LNVAVSAPWSEEVRASILLFDDDAPDDDALVGAVVALVPDGEVVVGVAPLPELPQAERTAPTTRRPTRPVARRQTRTREDDVFVMGELLLLVVRLRTQSGGV